MSYETFITRAVDLLGTERREDVERLARATLPSVASLLETDALRRVREAVDPTIAAHMAVVAGSDFDRSVDALYRRVSDATRLPLGRAAELADVVCEALAGELSVETLAHLRHLNDPAWRALFVVRARRSFHLDEPAPPHAPPRSTLAEAKPGSRHPISEAGPTDAHAESVARSDIPHEATKLSTATGLTQERREHTLATGAPPAPTRPVSRA